VAAMSMQKKKMNKRSQLIGAVFLLLFFALIFRFYTLQIVEAAFYQEKAEVMYNKESTLKASRGSINDRSGAPLAKEATSYTVVAILSPNVKNRVIDIFETAKTLAPLLDMSVDQLQELLSQDNRYQVELRPGGRQINRAMMQEIVALGLPGITFIEEPKRYYTNNDFASHVIGFLNRDREPIMGLESTLDHLLRGEEGHIQFTKDRKGNRLPEGLKGITPPINGADIYLTLDERIQLYVEQALDEAQSTYSPEKMTVIVSRPQTGEILAMASRPSFNPNEYSSIENYVNHATSSTFEPGSTFKIVTLAAAIEEGKYNGEDTYQSGSYTKVPGNTIRDHVRGGWGKISFLEGVQKSSNVAFTILGWELLNKEVFYDYIYRFGFGAPTGIDLPNESKGYVRPPHSAYPIDVATMTFGQGVSVTAIQQVAAINAIANGGKLLKPYIIDRIENTSTGEIILKNQPVVENDHVVSKETAKEVANILETVVTEGTGKNFYIEGYSVAGKTGTAQKIGPNGRYIEGKYNHSFIGFAPKDDPELLVYVLVDSPEVEHYNMGGSVVAGIFKSIMQNSLQYLSISPEIEEVMISQEKAQKKVLGNYTDMSIMTARQKAEAEGLEVLVLGDGSFVTEQSPAEQSIYFEKDRLYLITSEIKQVILPDFKGWSLREVRDWAGMAQVKIETSGSGYVSNQNKEAGEIVKIGESISVDLEPRYEVQDSE
jgi:penicillin-binding protein 2B